MGLQLCDRKGRDENQYISQQLAARKTVCRVCCTSMKPIKNCSCHGMTAWVYKDENLMNPCKCFHDFSLQKFLEIIFCIGKSAFLSLYQCKNGISISNAVLKSAYQT